MAEIFDENSRQVHFNRAVAKFHQRVLGIVREIDSDISSRGFGSISGHPRLHEVFISPRTVADEMMRFDVRHAEFLRDCAAARGEWHGPNPFNEANERQICDWIERTLAQLPGQVHRESKKLSMSNEGSWSDRTTPIAEDINYDVRQFYAEQRTLFDLSRKSDPRPPLKDVTEQGNQDRKSKEARRMPESNRKIFIGHGGSKSWKELKDFLSERLKLEWQEFNREPAAGISTKERLESMLDDSGFAFIVMTAEDDHADGTKHARENEIHELGLFQGHLGFKRAIVLFEKGCEEFSNIVGLTQIRFEKDKISSCFEEIRRVLEREGIIGGTPSSPATEAGGTGVGSRMAGLSIEAVRYFMSLSRPRNQNGVALNNFDKFPNPKSEAFREFMESFLKRALVRRTTTAYVITKGGYEEADSLWRSFLLRTIDHLQKADVYKYVDSADIANAARLDDGPTEESALNGHLKMLDQLGLVEAVTVDGGIGGARLTQSGRDYLRSLDVVDFPPPD